MIFKNILVGNFNLVLCVHIFRLLREFTDLQRTILDQEDISRPESATAAKSHSALEQLRTKARFVQVNLSVLSSNYLLKIYTF